ncbi:MAG: VOC family protein, partial [Rhodospirillaceae bacterium]
MPVDTLHHFTVLTDDMTRTTTFFKDVLGFTEGFTPKVDFKLTWLYAGEVPVIHVVEKDDPGAPGCARVDHVAFRCSDYLD